MAKKKKKAKDARGYSQGSPSNHTKQNATANANNKSKAPSVSTKTHSDMKDLLHQFDYSNDHDNMLGSSNYISSNQTMHRNASRSKAINTTIIVPPSDRSSSDCGNLF